MSHRAFYDDSFVLAELSFRQEVLLAVIQAVAVLVGVIAGLVVGAKQARKGWASQADTERDRALRTERISLYRRMIEAAGIVLKTAAEAAQDKERLQTALVANAPWSQLAGECQLIGAPDVGQVASDIEIRRKDLLNSEHVQSDFGQMLTDNDAIMTRLIDACRDDLAQMKF